ncbi:MAG TPA: pyridoxamine 5'-phosphate oxidase [Solirubrobacteraceae bacterium]|nr:pyridoxamine 5'-phosphate oxidase [Solirubrobacteraceae bacterium]
MDNPLRLVKEWFEEAAASGIIEAERMALATATPDGRPSVRIVLLKGIDDEGIQFFTNYGSRKGRELDANPRAAVTFYWQPLQRAARLEGPVEKLTAAESDAYFASRPRGAQVGAWASAQGSTLRDRAELEARVRAVEERYPDEVPRPDYWGGYRLRPDAVELWQGRPDRLHDREHFLLREDGSWRSERLSP